MPINWELGFVHKINWELGSANQLGAQGGGGALH